MKMANWILASLLGLILAAAPQLAAQQSSSNSPASKGQQNGFLWNEEFDGSSNTDGQVMTLTSSTGFNFSRALGVDAGIPLYFVRASSSTAGASSENGIGNAFADVRLALLNPVLNYRTTLTGAVPTGDSKKGLSTGHATYDWNNRLDRGFGPWTPFLDAGFANSIPDRLFFSRPFTSFGNLAHFEAGTEYNFWRFLSLGGSAYDIAPWGPQTIISRIVHTPGSGAASHGRVFETSGETTGGASLTRDNGFNAWVDASPSPVVDFELGYSHSVHFALNTVSFGIAVNMESLMKRTRGQ